MALLFIVHVPYKPDDEDECFANLSKNLSKEDEPVSEKDCDTQEKCPDVSKNISEKNVDEAAVIDTTENVENDPEILKLSEDSVSVKSADCSVIPKSNSLATKPESTEVKPVEQEEVKDTTEEATIAGAETEVTEDKSKSLDTNPDSTEAKSDTDEVQVEKIEVELKDDDLIDAPLTPLIQKMPVHKEIEIELEKLDVDNIDMHFVDDGQSLKFSFVEEDCQRSEVILNRLRKICAGQTGANISVFPANLHETFGDDFDGSSKGADDVSLKKNPSEEVAQKESMFRKSVKSRLLVAQVVKSVTDNACFTFDYLLLLILASLISCIGLAENSSVVSVASMLISPLMGPILAATFGHVIHNYDLRNLGLKSEIIGLVICLIIGFLFGLICGGVGLYGAVWGSTDAWPTSEMRSRGMLRSLWVGMIIALPSGAGVAISVLGGNAGSLVGVAISASLLPPACNAGMLWAYAFLAAIKPPATVSSIVTPEPVTTIATNLVNTTFTNGTFTNTTTPYNTTVLSSATTTTAFVCQPLYNNAYESVYFCNVAHEAALLGLVSLSLTLLNICCIMVMGVLVLKVKEVSPQTAASGVDNFWKEDIQVARTYYTTARGAASKSLGKMFLDEYKKIQVEKQKSETAESSDMSSELATIELHNILQDVENSPACQNVISKLLIRPVKGVTEEIDNEYNEAALLISNKLEKQRPHHTFHHVPKTSHRGIADIKAAFKSRKTLSMVIDPALLEQFKQYDKQNKSEEIEDARVEIMSEDKGPANLRGSRRFFNLSNPKNSKLMKRRTPKVKFQVTKVDEEENENLV